MDKWFVTSMTIWGIFIGALPGISAITGWNISAGDIAGLNEGFSQFADGANVLVGAILAVYGRNRSDGGNLKLLPTKAP